MKRWMLVLSCVGLFADTSQTGDTAGYIDGLDEVNAKRATRGLPPYIRDEGLTQAAGSCASYRASRLMFGHTSNDFAFLPNGSHADSAGCAAYPPSYGWMSCDIWEPQRYAGAAWVMGSDGRRFMHVFVSNSSSGFTSNSPSVGASVSETSQLMRLPTEVSVQSYQPMCSYPTTTARRGIFRRR